MEKWRNNFFVVEHDFVNVINNLQKFHVNIISLSEVISIYSLSHFTLESVVFSHRCWVIEHNFIKNKYNYSLFSQNVSNKYQSNSLIIFWVIKISYDTAGPPAPGRVKFCIKLNILELNIVNIVILELQLETLWTNLKRKC